MHRRAATGSEFFVFEFLDPPPPAVDLPPPIRTTVMFWTVQGMDARRVDERLRDRFDSRLPPERIALIAPADCEPALAAVADDGRLLARARDMTGDLDKPIALYMFGADGTLAALRGERPLDGDAMFLHGLRDLFNGSGAMLDGRSRHHYAKPSGAHSSRFLRTAEALRSSPETDFVAFGLLPYLDGQTREIYTDTSAINPVGYSLIALRARLSSDAAYTMTVDSFSSYEGMPQFSPTDARTAICLVSASTAAALADKVIAEQGLRPEHVITLFYAGEEIPRQGSVLCDLVHPEGEDSVPPIENHEEGTCPDCAAGLPTVTMTGDQFLPANALTTSVLVKAADAPVKLRPLVRLLLPHRAVSCRVAGPGFGERPEFAFDLRHLVAAPAGLFASLTSRAVPASTRWIIHLDDPDSTDLAARASSLVPGLNPQQIVSNRELSGAEPPAVGGDTVLVVAADAGDGRELLAISQRLRQVLGTGLLCYLIGLARPTEPPFKTVVSDLAFGEHGPRSHPVDVGLELCLPNTPAGDTAFTRELNILQALAARGTFDTASHGAVRAPADLRRHVDDRIDTLKSGDMEGGVGLVDHLLLPSTAPVDGDDVLRLRPTFAFWNEVAYEASGVTQADVFMTISAVLHQLRQPGKGAQSLFDRDHNRAVLDPGNFTRYNDGLTQGCFLRAARPAELDYHAERDLSRKMREILEVLLDSRARSAGEASSEFLLALATGQLKLATVDTQRLLAPFVEAIAAGTSDLPTLDQALVLAAATQ
jgi:hypothetical protein